MGRLERANFAAPQIMNRCWRLLLCALAAEAARPQWLDPTYHFRRAANHMNDPNVRCSVSLLHLAAPTASRPSSPAPSARLTLRLQGLMWTRDSSGNVTYHMYFQSSNPGQTIGSIWGHTVR